mgnify:CR=1 FL=1
MSADGQPDHTSSKGKAASVCLSELLFALTVVCPQLLFALNCSVPSATVCPQLQCALNYCLPSTDVCPQLFTFSNNSCKVATSAVTAALCVRIIFFYTFKVRRTVCLSPLFACLNCSPSTVHLSQLFACLNCPPFFFYTLKLGQKNLQSPLKLTLSSSGLLLPLALEVLLFALNWIVSLLLPPAIN